MIKSILVALDASPAADSGLSIASSIAGLTDADLVGLYVEDETRFFRAPIGSVLAGLTGDTISPAPLEPQKLLEEQARVQSESEALKNRFQEKCDKTAITGRFLSISGRPSEVIVDAARRVDFVVIGNAGSHVGLERIGFTTNSLLRSTTRPVLVVPPEPNGESKIVLAYDGSRAAERALRVVAELGEITDLRNIHVLSVDDDVENGERIQKPALEYLKSYELNVTPVIIDGKPANQIVRYAEEVDASLIALGAFGSNRVVDFIFGSTTEYILKESRAAVLLMP